MTPPCFMDFIAMLSIKDITTCRLYTIQYIYLSVEAGNKVVEKGWPTEAVGVVVRINNKIQVRLLSFFHSFIFTFLKKGRIC